MITTAIAALVNFWCGRTLRDGGHAVVGRHLSKIARHAVAAWDFWVKDNLGHILSKITQDHMILSIYIGAGYSLQRRWNE